MAVCRVHVHKDICLHESDSGVSLLSSNVFHTIRSENTERAQHADGVVVAAVVGGGVLGVVCVCVCCSARLFAPLVCLRRALQIMW